MSPAAVRTTRDPIAKPAQAVYRFFEFSLLGMLISGFAAVVSSGALDWPTSALAILALLTRGLMVAEVITLRIPGRLTGVLALAYIGFFPLDYYYVSGTFLTATVHMVFFLAGLKLLTARTPRDYGYLEVIAGIELIAAAMVASGPGFLLCLGLFVLCAIATFTSSEVRRASSLPLKSQPGVDRDPGVVPASEASGTLAVSRAGLQGFGRRLGVLSACLFTGILLMTAALFFLLPRTARAAFSRFAPQRYHLAGFSNSVTLGEIGAIKQSSDPVMHVRSYQGEGFLPVKWRGAALAEFDGRRWFNPPGEDRLVRIEGGVIAIRTATQGMRQGHNLIYQVHLSPLIADTLFFAGNPETVSIDVPFLRYSRHGAFHVAPRFGTQGLNYSVYGFLPDEWAEVRFTAFPLGPSMREELLSLPPLDARIPELARQMTAGADTEVDRARAIERHLRQDYGYTLELLKNPVPDPLAYFLFERKKGHCEYFASAMAVMLRTIGIPARVITGFQSGVYNPMTGWQIVRASDAHSWVEAWLDGRGWTTFDPTPADPNAASPGLLSRLALFSDTAQQFWQDWVMSYDLDHQAALASRMKDASHDFRLPHWDEIVAGLNAAIFGVRWLPLLAAISVLAALGVLLAPRVDAWWKRRARERRLARGEAEKTDATILYQQMLSTLRRRGLEKPPWLTPAEFVRVIPARDVATLVGDATSAYNRLRFAAAPATSPERWEAASRMMAVLEQIENL